MTLYQFNTILTRRLELTRAVLDQKKHHYANDADRLHNFKVMAVLQRETQGESLLGVLVKHWFSIKEMVEHHAKTGTVPSQEVVDEKIGDALNYLVLLDAIFTEERSDATLQHGTERSGGDGGP